MKRNFHFVVLAVVLAAASPGCHSYGIDVTIHNDAAVPLRNVEVSYPGATFGSSSIAAGASYWYHIKPTEDGDVMLGFEQPDGKTFKQKQSFVRKGESGKLIIIVDQDSNRAWHTRVERK